jgi:hypothetical protein
MSHIFPRGPEGHERGISLKQTFIFASDIFAFITNRFPRGGASPRFSCYGPSQLPRRLSNSSA